MEALALSWQKAQAVWVHTPRFIPLPLYIQTPAERAHWGLAQDLARVHLRSGQILLNGPRIEAEGLLPYLTEILAHEAGHLFYCPASHLVHQRSLEILAQILPEYLSSLPALANLWQDLLINHSLAHKSDLNLIGFLQKWAPAQPSELWKRVLRAYEILLRLPAGQVLKERLPLHQEADAFELADVVYSSKTQDLKGLSTFARLCRPALLQEPHPLLLSEGTDLGEAHDLNGALTHASSKPPAETSHPGKTLPLFKPEKAEKSAHAGHLGQESPRHFLHFWQAWGQTLSEQEACIAFYRQKAQPLLAPWKIPMQTQPQEPLLEGTDPWLLDTPIEEIAWIDSLIQSPRIVPGFTTVKQYWSNDTKKNTRLPIQALDIYLDASGSLPNPAHTCSWPVLSAVVLALSALHQGWKVRITLWSGPDEGLETTPFTRNEQQVLSLLSHYLGGATRFPSDLLSERYLRPASEACHLLLISDQGLLEALASSELKSLLKTSLQNARGGGSLLLNLPEYLQTPAEVLPFQKMGWFFHAVSSEQDIQQLMRALLMRLSHA
ncbi:hypothetical protein COW36_00270 [bacterium (Candidatus Blackallbacteria) CG17_big_fil_post_rev_8_21_14_2_50_48_46]|uniref:VWA domain-containing protein n=1 Tax=bacterium (Candidatus Blackallbacteria) CG17_big_fil_post_rev_8_21_14_2_50_48_46 TaxID=2014261 RepID=A0A2M7GAZ7_9BACT|nr:MAG: hypothetical protein COW64_10900 [bacterium (Candidatus Blackallbacteria) CG18_big_fil_WC_8_21_14_2_50_49_26]PIW19310.1 MAG: hypothetical protein COW36_00270 [bacterium (Candidatus Blackallbacteria) CG17_big_fil_post_rev_8_21_14_2_50_48_46]PIW49086.1 MAG: hypothetical protein COW20_08185 [bacterium (Candidatus Blackallbacteria) CG13_big_fil_rev_8_21_14_2_50_49_14]